MVSERRRAPSSWERLAWGARPKGQGLNNQGIGVPTKKHYQESPPKNERNMGPDGKYAGAVVGAAIRPSSATLE